MIKTKDMQAIHETALKQFDAAATATQAQREESLSDRRFHSIRGAQWEGAYGEQFSNRVKLEVNTVNAAVMRVVNEFRLNRITVDYLSKDGDAHDELADLCDGLYRADEQDSRAEEAYDAAFEECAGGGFGAWRLVTEYEDEYDEDNDNQRIRFEPITDADTCVYFDINAKRQDKSDAKHCFLLLGMTRDAYEGEYDDSVESWDPVVSDCEFDWSTPDLVYVAEYYKVTETTETVYTYRDLSGDETKYTEQQFKDDEGLKKRLRGLGSKKVGERKVKRRVVRKYIMSGGGILEDCGVIAGTEIPVIPVYGKRFFIEGVERWAGVVRYAKDPARLNNMQISSLGDLAARSSIPKPVVTPSQIAGHETLWAESAVNDPAFLMLNPLEDANGNEIPSGPVAYTQPAQIPAATAALIEIAQQAQRDVLGNQEAGEQVDAELSGKALQMIHTRLDMQSNIYMSNFAKAIRRCGEVWLSMAKDVYVEDGRKMKTVLDSGKVKSQELNAKTLDDDGKVTSSTDLTKAKFDVVVDVGPQSSTKRSATVTALSNLLPLVQDAADAKVIQAAILRNMEGEGMDGMRNFFRKQLVSMGVEDPSDEDLKEMEAAAQQPQAPDPQAEYLAAEAEEARANAAYKMADTTKTLAETEKVQAQTNEILQSMQRPAAPAQPI